MSGDRRRSKQMLSRLGMSGIPPIVFNKLTTAVKNLGLYKDLIGGHKLHILASKLTRVFALYIVLRISFPPKLRLCLWSLIIPLIDYGDVCYLNLNADLLAKLDRILNNCIRFFFNLRKYDPVSAFCS